MVVPQNDAPATDETVASSPMEFISYNCEVNEGFAKFLKTWRFETFGYNYNVMTILGCQSSGKSFLLNALFGLNFQVMDTMKGHSQTTKGLWAAVIKSKAENSNSTLVIDVEGTDSIERGEGHLTFEHRSSLFCLALSDCVIINLWYHSLGNLTGSNYGLMKTVVEANLELSCATDQKHPKTILFFCVRDWFKGLTPMETIRNNIINNYMASIWNEISKPDRFKDMKIDDFFHIEVFGFPNAITDPDAFNTDAYKLRKHWESNVKPKLYSRMIPSDGFFVYATNIWNTIKEQNHLDIPTQREMLANFRCNEIKATVVESKTSLINDATLEAQGDIMLDFQAWVRELLNSSLEQYLVQASRYDTAICTNVAKTMITTLCEKIQPIFDASMSILSKDLILEFSVCVGKEFDITGSGKFIKIGDNKCVDVWPKFSTACESIVEDLNKEFISLSKDYNIKFESSDISLEHKFDCHSSLDQFNAHLKGEIDLVRARHLEILKEQIKDIGNSAFKIIEHLLLEPGLTVEKYWGSVNTLIGRCYKKVMSNYSESYVGLLGKDVNTSEFGYLAFIILLQTTKDNLERIEKRISDIIISRFESFFQYQEYKGEQIPRDWGKATSEFLKNKYAESTKEALVIVDILRDPQPLNIEVPNFDVQSIKADHLLYRDFTHAIDDLDVSNCTLTEDIIVETVSYCKRRFQESLRSAEVIQTAGSRISNWRNIPPMFWVLLLICGWNELVAIIRTVFKLYIIVPLLFFIYFVSNQFSGVAFGTDLKQYRDLIVETLVHLFKSVVSWLFHLLYSFMSAKEDKSTGKEKEG